MNTTTPSLVLIVGGCRSGKSRFALELASRLGKRKVFIATAEPFDDEMRERIAKHRAARGPEWRTVEAPVALDQAVRDHAADADVIVIDCLTVWLGNLLFPDPQSSRWKPDAFSSLLAALAARRVHVIAVSDEVGMGIVPENALARRFRDEQGRLNQQVAALADSVVFMAAGLPLALKGKLP
jgi:adenosylcobinamide kinase / adenosylcobinamide-phosphate guanylyltransferase